MEFLDTPEPAPRPSGVTRPSVHFGQLPPSHSAQEGASKPLYYTPGPPPPPPQPQSETPSPYRMQGYPAAPQPYEGGAAAAESGLGTAPPPTAAQRAADLLLWRAPVLSALVLGAGLLLLAALEFLLRGDHRMTLLTGPAALSSPHASSSSLHPANFYKITSFMRRIL